MKLLGSGRELFGTVIRSGKMDKTVTVSGEEGFLPLKDRLIHYSYIHTYIHAMEGGDF